MAFSLDDGTELWRKTTEPDYGPLQTASDAVIPQGTAVYRHNVEVIDPHTGRVAWTRQVGTPRESDVQLAATQRTVVAVIAPHDTTQPIQAAVWDLTSGDERWRVELGSTARRTVDVTAADGYVYMVITDQTSQNTLVTLRETTGEVLTSRDLDYHGRPVVRNEQPYVVIGDLILSGGR